MPERPDSQRRAIHQVIAKHLYNQGYRENWEPIRSPFDKHDKPEPVLEIWRCKRCDAECAGENKDRLCFTCENLPEEVK